MISRLELRPAVTHTLLLLIVVIAVSFGVATDPSVNLWSLQYLWAATSESSSTAHFSTLSASLPIQHQNGQIWQARAALAHGEPLRATQQLAPAMAAGFYDAQRLQAEIFYAQHEYEEALQRWHQLGEVSSLLVAGRELMLSGNKQMAQLAYEYAYDADSQQAVRPFAQFLWREMDKRNHALELLHQHAVTFPTSRYYFDWLSEMAAIYVADSQFEEAEGLYRQLLTIAPERYQDWIALGWIYEEQGARFDLVLSQFERAILASPTNGEGYYAKAQLLEKHALYAEAELYYTEAIDRTPNRVWWYLERANVVQEAGDLERAIALYNDVQQRFPDSMQAHFQAAGALKSAGENAFAIHAIEVAIQLSQIDQSVSPVSKINVFIRAGQIYEVAGKVQRALEMYQTALKLDPISEEALAGLERLQ